MSAGLVIFVFAATAMAVATLVRAVQTRGTLARFRQRWPSLVAERQNIDVEGVRQALAERRVSFLIPAWNERDSLPRLMDDLAALPLPNLEVLISAGGDDGTYGVALERAASQPELFRVYEQQRGQGKQRALRDLFGHATGDVVYLTDADCRMTLELVAGTLAPVLLQGETATTTGGAPDPRGPHASLTLARMATYLTHWLRQGTHTEELSGGNIACAADVIAKTDAFSRNAPIGTDVALARALVQAGHRIRFVALPMVETEFGSSLREMARQLSRWTRNAWYHDRRVPVFQLLLSTLWWAAAIVGTLSYLPLSLLMVPMLVGYLYALHPGVHVLATVFPQTRISHPAFVAVALLHQILPLLALRDHLSRRDRERW